MNEGERIKEIRIALNLTLEQFGIKVGVTKAAMSNIEKGNRNVTEQMRKAICREFNVNYDYLMYDEGEMFSNLPQTVLDELCRQYNMDDFDKQLIALYLEMTEDERGLLKRKIRELFLKMENRDSPQ